MLRLYGQVNTMAKVLYTGGKDWIIGPHAYAYYGEGSPLAVYKSKWPWRLQKVIKSPTTTAIDVDWPEATRREIHYLIECIFLATGIEVK